MRAAQQKTGSALDPVAEAAIWLATGGTDKTQAVVPQLRERFGLSARDAVAAIREANLVRARAT